MYVCVGTILLVGWLLLDFLRGSPPSAGKNQVPSNRPNTHAIGANEERERVTEGLSGTQPQADINLTLIRH